MIYGEDVPKMNQVTKEDVSVLFDDLAAVVNGAVVQSFEERSTVIIDREDVTLIFDCANGDSLWVSFWG